MTGMRFERTNLPDSLGESRHDNIKLRVLRVLAEQEGLGIHLDNDVDTGESIYDLGIDSLKYVVLVLAIEDEFSVQFDDDFHSEFRVITLELLINAIGDKLDTRQT